MSSFDADTKQQRLPTLGDYLTFWAFLLIIAGALGWSVAYAIAHPALSLQQVSSAAVFVLTILGTIGGFSATWYLIASPGTNDDGLSVNALHLLAIERVWRYGLGMLLLALAISALWYASTHVIATT